MFDDPRVLDAKKRQLGEHQPADVGVFDLSRDGSLTVFHQRVAMKHECGICRGQGHVWMCLECGRRNCSRYMKGHAIDHHTATGHRYAQEPTTKVIWDYVEDCFVDPRECKKDHHLESHVQAFSFANLTTDATETLEERKHRLWKIQMVEVEALA